MNQPEIPLDPGNLSLGAEVAAQRAIGLMHLLAVAYNGYDDRNGGPSQDEKDGIHSLVYETGVNLSRALDQAFEVLLPPTRKLSQKGPGS